MLPPKLDDFHVDANNRPAWRAALSSITMNAPIVLYGPVGTGKTTLLAYIARGCWKDDLDKGIYHPARSDRPYQGWMGVPFFFTTAAEYCEDVKAWWGKKFEGPAGAERYYRAEGVAAECRRLFVDDLGVEEATPKNTQLITDLLTARDARGLPTWVTTNLTRDDFLPRYGLRAWDRLRASNSFVELLGESRRKVSA